MVVGNLEDQKLLVGHPLAFLRHMGLEKAFHKCTGECAILHSSLEVISGQKVLLPTVVHLETGNQFMGFLRGEPKIKYSKEVQFFIETNQFWQSTKFAWSP
jgi:hypothetical protein